MTADARTAIGIDVGGTNIRAARVASDGQLLEHMAEPVAADREAFAAQLLRLVETVKNDDPVGVGVGIPGRVDAPSGTILSAGYLDIASLNIPRLISDNLELAARVENDATMALIAEAHARSHSTHSLMLIVTIGTGIGGAILQNGLPWYGGGISGQFGHLVVAEGGPLCNCGRRGCVETFSSGSALARLSEEVGLPAGLSAQDLLARAERGDAVAAGVLESWTRPFQRALEALVAAFDPDLIVLGGGLGKDMAAAIARLENASTWFDLPVEPAILGDNAGVIGAGLRCFAGGTS